MLASTVALCELVACGDTLVDRLVEAAGDALTPDERDAASDADDDGEGLVERPVLAVFELVAVVATVAVAVLDITLVTETDTLAVRNREADGDTVVDHCTDEVATVLGLPAPDTVAVADRVFEAVGEALLLDDTVRDDDEDRVDEDVTLGDTPVDAL